MDPDAAEFHRVFLKGRYGYPQISREAQTAKFQNMKTAYFQEPQEKPVWQLPGIKVTRLTEEEQLAAMRNQFSERNMVEQAVQIEEKMEDKKSMDTIKTFYCSHAFQTVKVQMSIFPIKYRICSKCGLVK